MLACFEAHNGERSCDYGQMSRDEIRRVIARIRNLRARLDKPTLQEIEREAVATRDAALKKIRNAFQERAPHYTPPRGAHWRVWANWIDANVRLHGQDGFKARFPFVDQILGSPSTEPGGGLGWNLLMAARDLEAHVYRRQP